MSDEMIKALAAKGGVIQINFGSSFLTEKADALVRRRWMKRAMLSWKSNGFDEEGEEA